jgi:hypothetical protein
MKERLSSKAAISLGTPRGQASEMLVWEQRWLRAGGSTEVRAVGSEAAGFVILQERPEQWLVG